MQYVGRAIGSVSKTWNSINPATLSGAIDIIVIEGDNGDLNCSPFHVRFGKFSLLRPSQKKVQFSVNGEPTDLPMKLGDGGEAFFVFETPNKVPKDLMTSPVVSPSLSASSSPASTSDGVPAETLQEPEFLDLSEPASGRARSVSPPPQKQAKLHSASTFGGADTDKWVTGDLSTAAHDPEQQQRIKDGAASAGNGNPPQFIREISADRMRELSRKLTDFNINSKLTDTGDVVLDMTGYKSGEDDFRASEALVKKILAEELGMGADLNFESIMGPDDEGNLRIYSRDDMYASDLASHSRYSPPSSPESTASQANSLSTVATSADGSSDGEHDSYYAKTLRLTSEQLKTLDLKPGKNEISFKVLQNKAVVNANLFYWDSKAPVVISDIDGTITKSDALGHVLTMIGRDWTHGGVAKLYTDIASNGYNIIYLTARSVGQADATRSYLNGIEQDDCKIPPGPVILSPDRTMAALRREVIMRKPEVFKMAALRDIQSLYDYKEGTPFFAGFGNRITDALSYRSVGIPSSKIFTINTNSEVHMELLELAGYRSSYVHIADLVDHFFPTQQQQLNRAVEQSFTDVNFWREPIPDISDLESLEETTGRSEEPLKRSSKNYAAAAAAGSAPSSPGTGTVDRMLESASLNSAEEPDTFGRIPGEEEPFEGDPRSPNSTNDLDDDGEEEADDDDDDYDDYEEDDYDSEAETEYDGSESVRRTRSPLKYTDSFASEPAHLEAARTARESLKDPN